MTKYSVILLDAQEQSPEARATLEQQIVKNFGFSADHTKELLSTFPAIFKKRLTKQQAETCLSQLEEIGVFAEIIADVEQNLEELDLLELDFDNDSSPSSKKLNSESVKPIIEQVEPELDLADLQEMLDLELSLESEERIKQIEAAPLPLVNQSSQPNQAQKVDHGLGPNELKFDSSDLDLANSHEEDLFNLDLESEQDLFASSAIGLEELVEGSPLAELFEPTEINLEPEELTNDPLGVLQDLAQAETEQFFGLAEPDEASLAPNLVEDTYPMQDYPPPAQVAVHTDDQQLNNNPAPPLNQSVNQSVDQPIEQPELTSEEILAKAFGKKASQSDSGEITANHFQPDENSADEDQLWEEQEPLPNSGRGSRVVLGIGVIAMLIVAGIVGPKAFSNSEQEIETTDATISPLMLAALLKEQKNILGSKQPAPALEAEILLQWSGEIKQGEVTAKIAISTRNGLPERATFSMSAEKPKQLSDEELFNGVSRPWLHSLEANQLSVVTAKVGEIKDNTQIAQLQGSGRAYLEERDTKRRALAEIRLTVTSTGAKELNGTWLVQTPDLSAEHREKPYYAARHQGGQYLIHAKGIFRLTPASETENLP